MLARCPGEAAYFATVQRALTDTLSVTRWRTARFSCLELPVKYRWLLAREVAAMAHIMHCTYRYEEGLRGGGNTPGSITFVGISMILYHGVATRWRVLQALEGFSS